MLRIIIPAAGLGTRFTEAGYTLPKPLIEADGVPMIQRVADMFKGIPDCEVLAVTTSNMARKVRDLGIKVIPIDYVQKGAAMTVLCANGYVEAEDEVVVVNSDNIFDYDMRAFIDSARQMNAIGSILTFEVEDGPWSYVRVWGSKVFEVREKVKISNIATAGAYYFNKWHSLRWAIMNEVISNDVYNGEFYLAPVYNYIIAASGIVTQHLISKDLFHCLGTPEALEEYNRVKAAS